MKLLPKLLLILTAVLPISFPAFGFYPMVDNYGKSQYRAKAQNWCITQGKSGNMWFANSGILEFDGKEWSLTNTYNMTDVRSVYYDDDSMRLYFGATNEFGYLHFDENYRMKYVSLIDSLKTTVGEIWGIHKTGDRFYLRENNNIFIYDGQGCEKISFDNKVTSSAVIDGKIYIYVSGKGLLEMSASKENDFSEVPGCDILENIKVSAIFRAEDNSIMLATESNGIYKYSNGKLEPADKGLYAKLSAATIYCGAASRSHRAYGTVKDGVFIIDNEDGSIMHLNTSSGLQNNTVLSMMFDLNGDLWLGLDNGISLIHLSSPEYNLLGDPRQYGAGYAAARYDGELWIGTNQGLFRLGDIENQKPAISGQIWDLKEIDGTLFCSHD